MTRLHVTLALVAAVMAAAAGATDLVSPPVDAGTGPERAGFIAAPDLARRIMNGDIRLRLVDLRPASAYQEFHIPTAVNAAPADLADALIPNTDVVLYGDSRALLSDAIRVVHARGQEVQVLREGVSEWLGRVHEPRLAVDATPEERAQFERAAPMSRFFGGVPLAGVPRAEVPAGYWTGAPRAGALLEAAALQSVARIRRRGC